MRFRARAFAPHFDAGRVGAIGYSAGGYAVLAAMQARSGWRDVAGHCLRHFVADRQFCFGGSGGQERSPRAERALPRAPDRRASAPTRLRIRAAVLLAPVAAVFSAAGLAPVRQPARIYSAANDQRLNSRFHGDWLYAALAAQGTPVELATTHGGHHAFMSPFPAAIKAEVGAAAQVHRVSIARRSSNGSRAKRLRSSRGPCGARAPGAPLRRTARCGGCSR